MAFVDVYVKSLLACLAIALLAGCSGAPLKPEAGCPAADSRDEMTQGYELSRCGRHQEAIAVFSSVVSVHPENKRARMELGYARQNTGNYSGAADDFELVSREPGEFQEQALGALKSLRDGGAAMKEAKRDVLLNAGYADLGSGRNAQARENFRLALENDPRLADIDKQLGYMSIAEGDYKGAARSFEEARRFAPDDCAAALEIGYIYARLHNDAKAEEAFVKAQWCSDPKARAAAAAALTSLRAADPSLYLDFTAVALYTARFQDKIAYTEAVAGWKPKAAWPVSFYAAARWSKDSRSRSGDIPEIYSDNAMSFGPGIKLQPKNMNLNLTAEVVPTWNLTRSAEHPDRTETNKRVVLADYAYWERRKLFADVGASLGWYSRYRDNIIAYAQGRGGFVAWAGGGARASVYVPVNASNDRNRDFFNNFVEVGAGAELVSTTDLALKLRAEYLRGFYMGIEGRDPNPYARAYNDFRIMLVYSIRFNKARRRRPQPDTLETRASPGGGTSGFRW